MRWNAFLSLALDDTDYSMFFDDKPPSSVDAEEEPSRADLSRTLVDRNVKIFSSYVWQLAAAYMASPEAPTLANSWKATPPVRVVSDTRLAW